MLNLKHFLGQWCFSLKYCGKVVRTQGIAAGKKKKKKGNYNLISIILQDYHHIYEEQNICQGIFAYGVIYNIHKNSVGMFLHYY